MKLIFGGFIEGNPVAQPRARFRVANVRGKHIPIPFGADSKQPITIWRTTLELNFNSVYPASPLIGPLRVDMAFYFARPQYAIDDPKYPDHPYWHEKQNDVDNLQKAVLDTMTTHRKGRYTYPRFFDNDGQVCVGMVCKYVCARNPFSDYGKPGVNIRLYQLTKEDNPHCKNLFKTTGVQG